MIVQEKINKDGQHIMRRCNELGLEMEDFKILDWSPMFCILIYEDGVKAENDAPDKKR